MKAIIQLVNASAVNLLGYEREALIGQPVFGLYADTPMGKEKARQIAQRINKGEKIRSEEMQMRRADDTSVWVSLTLQPIFDSQDQVVGRLAIVEDITQRKQIEESLRIRTQAIEASIESMSIADARLPDMPLFYVNPAFEAVTGYSAEEVLGKNCRFLQGDDKDQPALDELRTALKEGQECVVTLRNYRKDGTLFWNELHLSPIHGDDKQVIYFLGGQKDVTAQKQAQSALQAEEQRQRHLAESLREVAAIISQNRGQEDILAKIMEQLRRVIEYDSGGIFLREADELVLTGGGGFDDTHLGYRVSLSSTLPEAQVFNQKRAYIIEDVRQDPNWQLWTEDDPVRGWMGVPLLVGEEAIGILVTDSFEVGTYGETEAQILRSFANQVATAVESVRMFAALQQARDELEQRVEERTAELSQVNASLSEQIIERESAEAALAQALAETGVLYTITQALAGLTNEQEMAEATLIHYLRQLNLPQGGIVIFDDDLIEGTVLAQMRNGTLHEPGTRFSIVEAPIVEAKKTVVISDVLNDPNFEKYRDSFYELGVKSVIFVPIFSQGKLIGSLGADAVDDIYEFSERQINFVEAVADRLGVAFENRRLFEQTGAALAQTETQAARLNLLNELATDLSQVADSEEAFRIVANKITKIVEGDRASIALLNDAGDKLEVFALDGAKGVLPTGTHLPVAGTMIGAVVTEKKVLLELNTAQSEWLDAQKLSEIGMQSILDAPLIVGREILGTLNVASQQENAYGASEEQLMVQIASTLAATLENQRLLEQFQQRSRQLEKVAQIEGALTQATTEEDILTAIISGLLEQPDRLVLQYIETDQNDQPLFLEPVAVWRDGAIQADDLTLGQRYRIDEFEMNKLFIEAPNEVIFITDVTTDPRMDAPIQALFTKLEVAAFATMPLRSGNRWQGLLSFDWHTPHDFSLDERFIFGQIMEAAAAIVAGRRAALAQQAALVEMKRLYQMGLELSSTLSYDEILQGMMRVIGSEDLTGGYLVTFELAQNGEPVMEIVQAARHTDNEEVAVPVGSRLYVSDIAFHQLCVQNPGKATFIGDVHTDERMDEQMRGLYRTSDTKAAAGLPLRLGTQWIGLALFVWKQVQSFTEADERLAQAMMPQVAVLMNNQLLFNEAQRRAYREQTIREITDKMQTATSLAQLVKITAEELGERFSVEQAVVELGIYAPKPALGQAENGYKQD